MLDIHITGVHYQVSNKLKEFIYEKLGALSRFNMGVEKMQVTIHAADKSGFRVDVEMHLPYGKDVVAHTRDETVYAAVDLIADKCAAQLRKLHSKRSSHRSDRHKATRASA